MVCFLLGFALMHEKNAEVQELEGRSADNVVKLLEGE